MAYYRTQHTSKGVRAAHLVGTPIIAAGLPLMFAKPRLGAPMFIGGWAMQILGHKLFEKNLPSTHKGWITYQLTGVIDVCEQYGEMLAARPEFAASAKPGCDEIARARPQRVAGRGSAPAVDRGSGQDLGQRDRRRGPHGKRQLLPTLAQSVEYVRTLHDRFHDQLVESIEAAIADLPPRPRQARTGDDHLPDGCLAEPATKALLVQSRTEAGLSDLVAARNESAAALIMPDLILLGWTPPEPIATLWSLPLPRLRWSNLVPGTATTRYATGCFDLPPRR